MTSVTPSVAGVALRYAIPIGSITTPLLAYSALSPTPTFGSLVLLLAVWNLNDSFLIPRKQHVWATIQTLLIAIAVGMAHAGPAIGALSTPSISIIMMSAFSLITTTIAHTSIIAAYHASRAMSTPWARLTFFPALWTTLWGIISQISPVGRLITWSPVVELGPYSWIRPVFGQWGLDWIVAAWAIVISEIAGNLIVGNSEGSDEPIAQLQGNLISVDDDDDDTNVAAHHEGSPSGGPILSQRPNFPSSWRVLGLTALLVVLALPSSLTPPLPPSLVDPNSTPLGLACALPDTSRSGHYGGPASLKEYIKTSKSLESSAQVILWPEGALRFDAAGDREKAFAEIRESMHGEKFWGITFDEHVSIDSPDGHWKAGMRRNGLVVMTDKGPVFEYYKRNLVPSTCHLSWSNIPLSPIPNHFSSKWWNPSR